MRFRLTLTPYYFCFLVSVIAFISCKKSLEEERNYAENRSIETYILRKSWTFNKVGGVYHVERFPSYGYQVNKGDTVTFWFKGYTLDGKVFETNIKSEARIAKLDTTIRSFNPIVIIAGKSNLIEGLDEGMLLLHEHEQATLIFSSSLGFGGDAVGPIEQWSPLVYDIEIIKVNGVGIEGEKAFIENLNLAADGFAEETSGLFYKQLILGVDYTPTIKDTIYGWYKGTLPDGTVIKDLGIGNQQIVLSSSDIPVGVRLGFLLTKNGGSSELVLPSFLGFGINGDGVVGSYQTLNYQIRFDSIK